MDSYLVMAYSYATTHSIVLHSTTGKVTHTRRNVSGPATQVGAAVGVIRIGATRVRHNPPSSAGQCSGGGPGFMAAKAGTLVTSDGADSAETAALLPSATMPDVVVSIEDEGKTFDTAVDVTDLVAQIKANPSLTHLKLKGNTLSKEAYRAVVDAILAVQTTSGATLKIIDSSDCFTRRGPSDIHTAMLALGEVVERKELVELNLGDNALSLQGAKILAPMIARCTSLSILRLNNTGLGPLGGKLIGLGLAEGARRGLRLKVLQLGRSRQENKGATEIAAAFELMKSLEEILMPQNGIKAAGITALAGAVSANPNLRVLDLNDNTFRPAGCTAMAAALSSIHGLREVNFGDCLLRPTGFEQIAQALVDNHPDMEKIDLTYNEIKRGNVDSLCQLLSGKSKLVKVELNGNILGEDDLDRIKVAIGAIETVADAEDVLGETDEMEDPEEEEEEEEEEDDTDDDDEESDTDGGDGSDTAEDESALVADVENQLKE
eukprot:m.416593 g.416593  ORF g.416593 m.416593 type:complete len:492 (+) comp30042_c0_seq1:85-1560(+)